MTQSYEAHLRSSDPLLMHAPTTVDPLNEMTRAIAAVTGKRKKTLEDHAAIARLEWEAGMYWDETEGPVLPAAALEASFRDGAKFVKLGAEFKRSVSVSGLDVRLEYDGPRTKDGLYAKGATFVDRRPVKVGMARLIRTRPIFRSWEAFVPLTVDEERVDPDTLRRVIFDAGRLVGVGDYRPRFGRYELVGLTST